MGPEREREGKVLESEDEEERSFDLVDRRSHDMVVVIDGDWRNTCGTREEKATSEIEWG